ncbi:hypothetical protein IMSAGC002_01884 [Lachnospiraceae bacterium]|nr:hypothetical protein IMSAGC002_01884 [Lachnospiraceae bacterium]
MKIFKKTEKKEWTEFQKSLDYFLEKEDIKLRDRFREAMNNKNVKLGGEILLQRMNILCIREKAGIY